MRDMLSNATKVSPTRNGTSRKKLEQEVTIHSEFAFHAAYMCDRACSRRCNIGQGNASGPAVEPEPEKLRVRGNRETLSRYADHSCGLRETI